MDDLLNQPKLRVVSASMKVRRRWAFHKTFAIGCRGWIGVQLGLLGVLSLRTLWGNWGFEDFLVLWGCSAGLCLSSVWLILGACDRYKYLRLVLRGRAKPKPENLVADHTTWGELIFGAYVMSWTMLGISAIFLSV